jgi:glycosyltransferase involved in cell wall biosynthesis
MALPAWPNGWPSTSGFFKRDSMRILLSLTYYRPHVSGLTIYVERLAEALVRQGHDATVLASRHDPRLPTEEFRNGVRVVREPVAVNISKGPIMPGFARTAHRLAGEHDVVSLHLPQFEAAAIAAPARTLQKPVFATYHCDLNLPDGLANRVIDQAVYSANAVTATLADRIVAYTQDYADHSKLLRRFAGKIVVIPPPVVMASPTPEDVARFRNEHGLDGRPVLGYASRFATEKGIEYAIEAMPALIERFPGLVMLFAGPYREVIGEDAYRARLEPKIAALGDHWRFIGTLSSDRLPAFYSALDALLVTSVNSTESFGLVQVEAMLSGTPVVTSDLPGVRQPVTMTGMGKIAAVADTDSLTDQVGDLLENRDAFVRPRIEIEQIFDLDRTVEAYEALFEEGIARRRKR